MGWEVGVSLGADWLPSTAFDCKTYELREAVMDDLEAIPFKPSSMIQSIYYSASQQALQVTFKNGSTGTYTGVDAETAGGFTRADSAGKYLNGFIKNQFQFQKV